MSTKQSSSEEYLNKVNEMDIPNVQPKDLDSTDFFTVARERRSVRYYDPTYQLADSDLREILETAILAPSSSNLQPWRFLVIREQEKKEILLPIAKNQKQVSDASAIIAVLGDIDAYKNAGRIYGEVVEQGRMEKEFADFYVNTINEHYGNLSEEHATNVALIDGGLVSMQLMLAAKAKGLDTVPMGGYDQKQFIETFNVPANLKPVMLIALGKGAKAGFEKNRLPLDELITEESF
ncbi:nitroreductase family protein [Fictibacillus aquaticus]|uniref:Nitroreductase family protein n=1 Tax=Fictibacillus aquaticus TaxID=2021314 RepID=A0A235F7E8_9BACL|nr:nitroreductase family protein [Fictibacillus aquaticus]OYD57158.1 nitroreductase family protein [Fictibacillus aquaticus]